MKKRLCVIGFFLCSILVGCHSQEEKREGNASPAAIEIEDNRIKAVPMEEEKFVYVERDKYPKEGYYQDKERTCSIQVQKISEEYATVIYFDALLQPCLVKAKKNQRGEYQFSFNQEQLGRYAQLDMYDSSSIMSAYSSSSTYQSETLDKMVENAYEVSFRIEDEKILVNIKIPPLFVKRYNLDAGVKELKLKDKSEKMEICDLFQCIGNYQEVYESIYQKDMTLIEVGKDRTTDRVSYVEVNFDEAWEERKGEETVLYQMGDINIFSTREDCDRILGEPIRDTGMGIEYSYNDDYIIHISFKEGKIREMGIYLESKKAAKKKYVERNFVLQGCRIIDASECYRKGGNVNLPKSAVAIAANSFSTGNVSETKRIKLEIPKHVNLEPEAFSEVGEMEITFEKGRKKIENRAFVDVGMCEVTITIPTSVESLGEYAFEQNYGISSKFQLNLPKALYEKYKKKNALKDLRERVIELY